MRSSELSGSRALEPFSAGEARSLLFEFALKRETLGLKVSLFAPVASTSFSYVRSVGFLLSPTSCLPFQETCVERVVSACPVLAVGGGGLGGLGAGFFLPSQGSQSGKGNKIRVPVNIRVETPRLSQTGLV